MRSRIMRATHWLLTTLVAGLLIAVLPEHPNVSALEAAIGGGGLALALASGVMLLARGAAQLPSPLAVLIGGTFVVALLSSAFSRAHFPTSACPSRLPRSDSLTSTPYRTRTS